jgi:hypothetical protein
MQGQFLMFDRNLDGGVALKGQIGGSLMFGRRTFSFGVASALMGQRAAASQTLSKPASGRGLFWGVQSTSSAILYGYGRTSTVVAPDILDDGKRFVEQTQRLVGTMPNVSLAATSLARSGTPALVDRISPPVAARLRDVLALDAQMARQAEKVSGLEAAAWLLTEGRSPVGATVYSALLDHARSINRPVFYLLSDQDMAPLQSAPDLVADDKTVDEKMINYLLTLRATIGPIGKHEETLYAERRAAALDRLENEMMVRGVPSLMRLGGVDEERMHALLADRVEAVLKKPAGGRALLLLPIGMLTGADGLLEKLRRQGMDVATLA